MIKWTLHIRLLMVFLVLLAGTLIIHFCFTRSEPVPYIEDMRNAEQLAQQWFDIIKKKKAEKGIVSDGGSAVPNRALIGDDYTLITTTLGSLPAKEVSTNPGFAALIVRWIKEVGVSEGAPVGVIASGSFPALIVSSLAALQTLGLEPVLITSLGSSTYGANQPEATWIDMEEWLIREGGLEARSVRVSMGAENDRGEGLTQEGRQMIKTAVQRNRRTLYFPSSLSESIRAKTELFEKEGIEILINIGGNQSAVGGCPHASTLPNGLHRQLRLCHHEERGVIQEMNARGVPVIHLLNIRDLAYRYGLDLLPGQQYVPSTNLYSRKTVDQTALVLTLLAGFLATILFLRQPRPKGTAGTKSVKQHSGGDRALR